MNKLSLFCMAGATALAANSATAESYRSVNYLEPSHPVSILAFDDWTREIATQTEGRITFQNFHGGSLVPAAAVLESVADGVAAVGFVTALYFPSDLPIAASLADFGWKSPDPYVLVAAFSDFAINDAEAQAEWIDNGVVYGMGFSTPVYYLLCKRPLSTLADFAGKRVRTPGTAYPRFVEKIGGVSVNMSSTEVYQAFDRNAVDCATQDITQLIAGAQLLEQIGGVTMLPMGPSFVGATHVYNKDFWASISEDDRRALLTAEAKTTAHLSIGYQIQVEAAVAAANEKGVVMSEPDATLKAAFDEFVASGMGSTEEAKRIGVADPDAVFARFAPYVTKWEGIIGGMKDRMDEEELTAILREHLYDKVDVSTYGID